MCLTIGKSVRGVAHRVSLTIHRLFGLHRYKRGMFPLSGDPVHYGHIETLIQALEFCDEVLLLILGNSQKNAALDMATRVAHAKFALRNIPGKHRVIIASSTGLMADEFLARGCDVLIRGVRDERDAVYERAYVEAQRDFFPWFKDANVEILTARGPFQTVSSSGIKEAIRHHVAVDRFVPIQTQQLLQETLVGQHFVGVTGTIAAGKSMVVKQLIEALGQEPYRVKAYPIAVDEIVREVYADPCPGCQEIRRQLSVRFGRGVLTVDGSDVDRVFLKSKLFGTPTADEDRRWVERLTMAQVRRIYRGKLAAIREKDAPNVPQLIVLEWAQAVASGLSRWSNNHVIVVGAPEAERAQAAEQRHISAERLAATLKTQGTTIDLICALQDRFFLDDFGTVISFNNRWLAAKVDVDHDRKVLIEQILELFPRLKFRA